MNYRLNRYTVFSGRGGKNAMAKYYGLAAVQGCLGALLVEGLSRAFPVPALAVKIPVDIVLFMASFVIQRDFVFRDK